MDRPLTLRISSRDNGQFKALKKALSSNVSYRSTGWVWLEGDHLCRAALNRGLQVRQWVWAERLYGSVDLSPSLWDVKAASAVQPTWVLDDALMRQLCTQSDRADIACLVSLPPVAEIDPSQATLVLDRVQDAGNVGSMLRSAAAFGYRQVLALQGTAALWSPKVLRAGMGAQFGLLLHEGVDAQALLKLRMPRLATSSHQGQYLHEENVAWPHAWLMGSEGEGLSAVCQELATQHVRIAQPGGEESLNVAVAAAICMHQGMQLRLNQMV